MPCGDSRDDDARKLGYKVMDNKLWDHHQKVEKLFERVLRGLSRKEGQALYRQLRKEWEKI